MTNLNRIIREPLLHFIVIGLLLFFIYQQQQSKTQQSIVVTEPVKAFLLEQSQLSRLEPLTVQEQRAVIDRYVDEEILYREAVQAGVSAYPRIRQQIIDAYRLDIIGPIDSPDDEQLRRFFEANKASFSTEATVTFRQVVTHKGALGEDDMLARLNSGQGTEELTDVLDVQSEFEATIAQLVSSFGRLQTAEILAFGDAAWHGPYSSLGNVHYLKQLGYQPATEPDFDTAKAWLEQEWLLARGREKLRDEIDLLRSQYIIEIDSQP